MCDCNVQLTVTVFHWSVLLANQMLVNIIVLKLGFELSELTSIK